MQYLVLVLVGLGSGSWGALIGAGGGFIIVPILFFLYDDKTAAIVTAISLVAVFFNGVSGAYAYARLRRIDYRTGLLFLSATLPGAVLGALLVNKIEKGLFQVIFGSLLCLVATYVLLRPGKMAPARALGRSPSRHVLDAGGNVYDYSVKTPLGFGLNFGIGFLAGLLGVGGGIFNVPSFVLLLGMPLRIATATSQFMLVGTSLVASITNIVQGDLTGQWGLAAALTVGSIAGGQLGARISQRIATAWVARALALGLFVVGGRLISVGAEAL